MAFGQLSALYHGRMPGRGRIDNRVDVDIPSLSKRLLKQSSNIHILQLQPHRVEIGIGNYFQAHAHIGRESVQSAVYIFGVQLHSYILSAVEIHTIHCACVGTKGQTRSVHRLSWVVRDDVFRCRDIFQEQPCALHVKELKIAAPLGALECDSKRLHVARTHSRAQARLIPTPARHDEESGVGRDGSAKVGGFRWALEPCAEAAKKMRCVSFLCETAGGIRDTLPCAPQRIKGRSRREYRTHAHQRSIQRPCRRLHC
mmetsp:Transcript_39342/g.63411  ORF Transcript_39342/g.63411 Transcript_39342/m.63411 type:complete len:257 (-) Transcript_39342:1313-2083(-)